LAQTQPDISLFNRAH